MGGGDREGTREAWRFPVLAQRAVAGSPRWVRHTRKLSGHRSNINEERRGLGKGAYNKVLMPTQVASLSPYKYRGRETDWDRKRMAVRDREKARHRHNAPADGRVKREVYQHSAYAPVAQWIEHQTTDL